MKGGIGERSWAEIDLAALLSNADHASKNGSREIMAVIKANAYGHGSVEVARALAGKVAYFGVAGVAEGLELRAAGVDEAIFLLGASLPAEIPKAVEAGFVFSLPDEKSALAIHEEAKRQGCQAEGHLVVDTGMGRIGMIDPPVDGLRRIADLEHLSVTGLASHFPSADEDLAFTKRQAEDFGEIVERAKGAGLNPRSIHIANSAGILAIGEGVVVGGLFRPGLMLYGVDPLDLDGGGEATSLRTVLQLKAAVTAVREIPKGWGISYGSSFVTPARMRVATVSIGYGDGYPRHLSGRGAEVLIGGRRCPILGRVTMDQVMVDVGGLDDVEEGGEVVLFGEQGSEVLGIEEVARWAGTIPWEILTGITPRVKRVYHRDGIPL